MKYRILRQVGRRGLLTPTFLPRSELLFCFPRGLSDVAAGSSLTQEMRVVAALALEGPADARRQCLLRGSPSVPVCLLGAVTRKANSRPAPGGTVPRKSSWPPGVVDSLVAHPGCELP